MSWSRRISTWGPSALIVGVVGAVLVWVAVTDPIVVPSAERSSVTGATSVAEMSLPPEVIPWDVAAADGTTASIAWGPRCDTETGRLALPTLAGPCYAPFTGDNGGATSVGVSATSVRIVAYQTNPDDTATSLIRNAGDGIAIGSPFETQLRFVELLSAFYELYGRSIELIEFTGTGQISDPVSAVADAETIARDLKPFAVIGGPLLTNAFADTLASRRVICINCTPGQGSEFYRQRSPYVWETGMNPEQNGLLLNEFVAKQLAGKPAEYAGDPSMHGLERVFGSVHIRLGPDTADIVDVLEADLAARGVKVAVDVPFDDALALQSTGRDMISRLKDAGVTTVVYTGDAFSPATLTTIATEQGYFPEWVSSGLALIDTNTIPRFFDQQQWAHAFGLANLSVGRADGANGPVDLFSWFYGEPPGQPGGSAALLFIPIALLMNAMQLAGADLTPEHIRDALFQAPPVQGVGSMSYGDRGIWEGSDFAGSDDHAIAWWDAEAEGTDEIGRDGKGLWRYVGGSERYKPGEIPTTPVALFDRSNSVTSVEVPPLADYPPLRR